MKNSIYSVLALLLFTSAAQAGTTAIHCEPVNKDKAWFQTLNFSVGRKDQLSGNYSGYQSEDKNVVTDFADKNQWMFPTLSLSRTKSATIIHMDFQGRMGSDEDKFDLTIAQDGSAVLSGESMADCGDGNWSDLGSSGYTCSVK